MACDDEGVVWKRTNGHLQSTGETQEEIWDDTALIEAYDRAVQKLKNEIIDDEKPASDPSTQNIKKQNIHDKSDWEVGDRCCALYSEDELYYKAVILEIIPENQTALVEFDWYENKEEVFLQDLLPEDYEGELEVAGSPSGANCCDVASEDGDASMTSTLDDSNEKINWKISDICYIPDGKGDYVQAVLNSFLSSTECNVTVINSRERRKIKISALSNEKLDVKKNKKSVTSSQPNAGPSSTKSKSSTFATSTNQFQHHPASLIGFPPPLTLPFPFGMDLTPNSHFYTSSYTSHTPAPPPPPPPVLSEEVIRGDEEALANMLMSWYMNGYHTGYYRGLQHKSKEERR